ncbi:head-tail adaptor protein [Rhizorhabdus histidinilytica]|uniref:head-tail adaptor protein n=1 Tax=Rhizorhabdus histidinilytica TaxID=439228 RepID=UPI002E27E4EA|nr:head-tail adaptor protein [Rhizorhabdus histidinilytica]
MRGSRTRVAAMIIRSGRLRDRITFQRPVADDSADGAGSGSWETVATNVPAEVQDLRPSRDERMNDGLTTASRRSRIVLRHRADITPDMRVLFGSRVMQIIGGPAVLGNRVGLEIMAEEYRPAGNPA